MMSQPERRTVLEPPKEVSPRLGQVIVETRILLQCVRDTYNLERREHGKPTIVPDRSLES